MAAVAVAAVHAVFLLPNREVIGLLFALEKGFIPVGSALIVVAYLAYSKRGPTAAFALGFLPALLALAAGYYAACRRFPEALAEPVLHYVIQVQPLFMDPDTYEGYLVEQWMVGLATGLPLCAAAALAGLVTRRAFSDRSAGPRG